MRDLPLLPLRRPVRPAPDRARKPRPAFTLIELLVVVGIVALLLAIVLPALAGARAQARQVACLSNLRQIGHAMLMHAQDHGQYVPIAGAVFAPGSATPTGLGDPGLRKYDYYTDNDIPRPMPLSAALAPYLQQEVRTDTAADLAADVSSGPVRSVFTCPADENPKQGITICEAWTTGWTAVPVWSSFGYNDAVFGCGDDGQPGTGVTGHDRLRGFLGGVARPSQTMLLCDAAPRAANPVGFLDFYDHPSPCTLRDAFYGHYAGDPSMFDQLRHRGRLNVLFADGHGELRTLPKPASTYTPTGPLDDVYLVGGSN